MIYPDELATKRISTVDPLDAPQTPWQALTIEGWYGRRTRDLQLTSDTAVWYHSGLPPVPIRWVLVKDPEGKFTPQAFLSTDVNAPLSKSCCGSVNGGKWK